MPVDFTLALLSGAGLALCLPRPGLCFLAWFALAPLFYVWARSTPARSFAAGFAAGFAFHGLALYWIYSTCRFALLPVPVALLAWAALAAFLALHWGLVGLAGTRLAEPLGPGLRPWAWAALWTGCLVAWERWTPRLNIDLLAYTQYRYLSLLQMGSVFGPHGLGFLIVAVNAALCAVFLAGRRKVRGAGARLALALALVAAVWVYGEVELFHRATAFSLSHGPRARVELLQPDVDQYRKFDERFAGEIRADFEELLSRPRSGPSLIVWPESSLTFMVDEGGAELPQASAVSRELQAFQVVGAVSRARGLDYNSALLVGPDGKLRGAYHKRQLVPFGEFVPLPFLKKYIGILNQLGGLSPGGRRQGLLEAPLGPAAASVCYEAMFPRLALLDASRGARTIVNVTNDGWYKDTWGPYQHFEANVFRAIENRVTVIRSANTGISAVIDPWGAVTARLELGRRGRLDAGVPIEDPFPNRSFYARHGDWFGLLCLLAAALLAGGRLLGLPRKIS